VALGVRRRRAAPGAGRDVPPAPARPLTPAGGGAVTRLIARGAATGEIAEELFLSTHTVRDHVKAIFHKVGVSSRGELVAKLFAEHYESALS
jgi:DNA-binding NarL/FixJ family response regulator